MSPSATHMPPLNVQAAKPRLEDAAEDLGAMILQGSVQQQGRRVSADVGAMMVACRTSRQLQTKR